MAAAASVAAVVVVSCKRKFVEAERIDLASVPVQTVNKMFFTTSENGLLKMRMEADVMQRFDNDSLSCEFFPEGFEVYGYDEDVYGELEIVGWNYDVDMDKVLSHQDKYRELLLALDNDNFELKREYRLMRNYMQELIDKHESTSDDLFDMLTD